MGEEPVEQRANFFLMNSTACSTMQSDCRGWAHIWGAFWRLPMTGLILPAKRGKKVMVVVGSGREWHYWLSPFSFCFVSSLPSVEFKVAGNTENALKVPAEKTIIILVSQCCCCCFFLVNVARVIFCGKPIISQQPEVMSLPHKCLPIRLEQTHCSKHWRRASVNYEGGRGLQATVIGSKRARAGAFFSLSLSLPPCVALFWRQHRS